MTLMITVRVSHCVQYSRVWLAGVTNKWDLRVN